MIRLAEEIRFWRVMTFPNHRITRHRPDDEPNDSRSRQAQHQKAGFEHFKNP
jgi:hypothetical protein